MSLVTNDHIAWWIGWDYSHQASIDERDAGLNYGRKMDKDNQQEVKMDAERVLEEAIRQNTAPWMVVQIVLPEIVTEPQEFLLSKRWKWWLEEYISVLQGKSSRFVRETLAWLREEMDEVTPRMRKTIEN